MANTDTIKLLKELEKAKIKAKKNETKKGGTKDAKEKTTTRGRKTISK